MKNSFDIIVIGGGVIGSAIAYFLTASDTFDGTVCVVERDPSYRIASSSLSASSIRQQFSTPLNIRMSQFGFHFLRNINEFLAIDGEAIDVGLHEKGYLILSDYRGVQQLRDHHQVQRENGANVALLDRAKLRQEFPWIQSGDIGLASLGRSGEGWFDANTLLWAFRKKAQRQGARFMADEVLGFERNGAEISTVALANAGALSARLYVNAGGPWASRLARLAGIQIPVRARKRQVFAFDCRQKVDGVPMVFDPSGLWFRPEGPHYICGKAPDLSKDPDDAPLEVEYSQFEDELWPALAHRVPAFEAIKLQNAWAGYYAVNTFDHNAILGLHPEVTNFVLANGFTGHGMQQSPAAGRGIAELLQFGHYRSLDLSDYGVERIERGQPLRENTVY